MTGIMSKLVVAVVSVVLLVGGAPLGRTQSSTPRETTWVTNGPVHAIASSPATVYIGGVFTYVGPCTGNGVPIDAATGQAAATFPNVNGLIFACVPDGSGGWYIGGNFTDVGGLPRNRLAHIRADGAVDPSWNPNPNLLVRALAVSGSTVYAGGDFWSIGGQ